MTFLRKVAKVGGAGLVVATTGGTGAATALMLMKKVNGTTYKIDRWGPVKEANQGNMINVHYGPSVAIDTADKVVISGTSFDGEYDVKRGRTRNDVWIRPNVEVTSNGTSNEATMRVKTTVQARLRHLGDAALATSRTGAKKTGNVVKGAAYWWINKVKKALIVLFVLFILYFIIKTVIQAKITKAVS